MIGTEGQGKRQMRIGSDTLVGFLSNIHREAKIIAWATSQKMLNNSMTQEVEMEKQPCMCALQSCWWRMMSGIDDGQKVNSDSSPVKAIFFPVYPLMQQIDNIIIVLRFIIIFKKAKLQCPTSTYNQYLQHRGGRYSKTTTGYILYRVDTHGYHSGMMLWHPAAMPSLTGDTMRGNRTTGLWSKSSALVCMHKTSYKSWSFKKNKNKMYSK